MTTGNQLVEPHDVASGPTDECRQELRDMADTPTCDRTTQLKEETDLENEATTEMDPGSTTLGARRHEGVTARHGQDFAPMVAWMDGPSPLPNPLRERLIEFLRATSGAEFDTKISEQEIRRRGYVALTTHYIREQQARNYVLPEDSTAMAASQKSHLFDQIVAGRVANSDEERRQENIAIFYRYIECENDRDYENMKKLFHATQFCSKTYFGNDPISPEAHVRMLKGLFRAFPDWFMVINEIIACDPGAVVGLITGRGTQHEEFFGRPPLTTK